MGSEFTFYDYLDDSEDNAIYIWLLGQGKRVKAKFDSWIDHLESTQLALWDRPYSAALHGECEGLFEIRPNVLGVEYRLFYFHGTARDPTLLFGAKEKGGRWEPLNACEQAFNRRANVIENPDKYRRRHVFGIS